MRRNALAMILGALGALAVAGCATIGEPAQSLVPTRYQTRTGPYAVYTNVPIAADSPAIRHLQALERQLEENLGLRVDPGVAPIEVYILNDREAFAHFLRFYYPELPARRAFFLAQGERRVVYTYLGERLDVDLRHEATHALLHATVADLPLWLDEGLAEYFEPADARDGLNLNPEHVERLPVDLAGGWKPDLKRLEALRDVRQMSPRDYRESWAWVHYLLNGPPAGKAALLGYLADLRTGGADARPLSARIDGGPALLAHLQRVPGRASEVRATATATTTVNRPALRLQDEPVEVASTAAERRHGLSGWIRRLFRGREE